VRGRLPANEVETAVSGGFGQMLNDRKAIPHRDAARRMPRGWNYVMMEKLAPRSGSRARRPLVATLVREGRLAEDHLAIDIDVDRAAEAARTPMLPRGVSTANYVMTVRLAFGGARSKSVNSR